MRKLLVSLFAVTLVLGAVEYARAGMIDYDRQQRRTGTAPAVSVPAKPAAVKIVAPKPAVPVKPAAQEIVIEGPAWMITMPVAQTDAEKSYDLNSDGQLQAAEVKIYLRDVIDTVNASGEKSVDSHVLRSYDLNKDGIISSSEAERIQEDVNK